jgi:hypothetical protein
MLKLTNLDTKIYCSRLYTLPTQTVDVGIAKINVSVNLIHVFTFTPNKSFKYDKLTRNK